MCVLGGCTPSLVYGIERHKKLRVICRRPHLPSVTRPLPGLWPPAPEVQYPEAQLMLNLSTRNARLLLTRSVEKGCWCRGRSTLSRRVGVAIQALAARGRSVLRHIPGPARSMIACRVRVEWTHLQTKRHVRCGNAIQGKRWRRVRYPCSCGGTQDLGMRLLSLDRCRL